MKHTTTTATPVTKAIIAKMPASLRKSSRVARLIASFSANVVCNDVSNEQVVRLFFRYLCDLHANTLLPFNSYTNARAEAFEIIHSWVIEICQKAYDRSWSQWGDAEEVLELAHEFAFSKVAERFDVGKYNCSNAVDTYVSRCFRNFCISLHRKKRIQIVDVDSIVKGEDPRDEHETMVFSPALMLDVRAHLAQEAPAYIEIFDFYYVQNLDVIEIAKKMEITANACYQRVHHLNKHLSHFGEWLLDQAA
jgi:RNA polymerase sigma factor (sigma-70 family)